MLHLYIEEILKHKIIVTVDEIVVYLQITVDKLLNLLIAYGVISLIVKKLKKFCWPQVDTCVNAKFAEAVLGFKLEFKLGGKISTVVLTINVLSCIDILIYLDDNSEPFDRFSVFFSPFIEESTMNFEL